jgi:hypothetical protein
MLIHHPSYVYDRDISTSTEEKEDVMDARGLKVEVREALKRRHKKSW